MSELESALIGRPTAGRCPAGPQRTVVPTWVVGGARLLLCALREIFDESAYTRFLARHGMPSCPSSYAAFLREQEMIKARRPKCC
jgi:hypothetical protein